VLAQKELIGGPWINQTRNRSVVPSMIRISLQIILECRKPCIFD